MIFYHRVCANPLKRGLYLGYLHVKINVEAIRVLAPETYPSVLPYTRIRDTPNVSKPEWQALLNLLIPSNSKEVPNDRDSHEITLFKKQLMKSAKKLVDKLGRHTCRQLDSQVQLWLLAQITVGHSFRQSVIRFL